jgi:hypothetical protein
MRYFFDVHNGTSTEDEEGLECPSDDAAVIEAARAVSGMSAEIAGVGELSIVVRDHGGPVAVVTVSIAIERKR